MNAWEGLLEGPRGDFPRGPAPNSALPPRPWTVALLLAFCLVPRAIAAWNWDVLWGDSLRYRYASMFLEQGSFDRGFAEFGLNIYPIILIPLRHLGIDWQITGKYFGVFVATVAVLPLWGWLRRMFDDRLAVMACLVYALHGKLIAISPLIIRDSTFWLLLVLTLYYVWRAVGELRIWLFLAAGVALTLAVHTRTEGWLLLIPLAGWGACRWFRGGADRLRLMVGALLCIAVIPASVAAVNVTWLRGHPHWEFLRAAHLQLAVDWWDSASGMHWTIPGSESAIPMQYTVPPPDAAILPAAKIASRIPPPPFATVLVPVALPPELTTPSWTLNFKLLERLAKACTWVGSALLLVGLVCGWRVFLRPEHLTLLGMNLLLLIVSRIRYGISGLDMRYFMPTVIIGVPWMALGIDHVIAATRRLIERHGEPSPRRSRILAGGLIAFALACSLVDAPISIPAYMRTHAALGRWIHEHVGPAPTIVGNIDQVALDTFYCDGQVIGICWPRDCLLVPMPVAITEREADAIVLWNDDENIAKEYLPIVEKRIGYYQYRRVDQNELPAGKDELMVFVRQ